MTTTLDPSRLSNDILKGFALLREFCINHSVGIVPHTLTQRLSREYGLDFNDMKDSAIALDRLESSAIERKILEQIAYQLGAHDGRRIVAALRGLSSKMSEGDFEFAVKAIESLDVNITAAFPASVFQAYKRGLLEAAAVLYIERNVPMLDRLHRSEMDYTREDGTRAEEMAEQAQTEIEMARAQGMRDYIVALARRARLSHAADQAAREMLTTRAVDLARNNARLTPLEALHRARLEIRAASGDDPYVRKFQDRAAWLPVPVNEIRDRIIEARRQQSGAIGIGQSARTRSAMH